MIRNPPHPCTVARIHLRIRFVTCSMQPPHCRRNVTSYHSIIAALQQLQDDETLAGLALNQARFLGDLEQQQLAQEHLHSGCSKRSSSSGHASEIQQGASRDINALNGRVQQLDQELGLSCCCSSSESLHKMECALMLQSASRCLMPPQHSSS